MEQKQIQTFQKFSYYLIFYTLLVIVWGAWVRISHSGDGCGASWPLCHDQLVPLQTETVGKTWIEYLHRLTSGLYGVVVLVQFFWGRKIFEKDHPILFWLWMSLGFMISEALLGAGLVLLGLVGNDESVGRVSIMTLHLLNSMILTASVASVWNFSKSSFIRSQLAFEKIKVSPKILISAFVIPFLVVGATGAWAALSSTLFPSQSFIESIMKEFAPDSHFLISLRTLHPIFGTILGAGLILLLILLKPMQINEEIRQRQKTLQYLILAQIFIGYLTMFLVSPIKLKFIHLILAHSSWIFLVLWVHSLRYQINKSILTQQ